MISRGFTQHYPDRVISSFYYDTLSFDLFNQSEDGISKRNKYRIRYYNYNFKSLKYENKKKISDSGSKLTLDQTFIQKYNCYDVYFNKPFKQLNNIVIPECLHIKYFPKSYIEYKRSYYLSSDYKLRITLDHQIYFGAIQTKSKKVIVSRRVGNPTDVLEIKYDNFYEPEENFINELSTNFNMILSRHSKYCNSINLLYN
nr:VTC domain-containing protein [Prochlorococcus marinus]